MTTAPCLAYGATHHCKCGNRLSILDTRGVCLDCQSDPARLAPVGFTCACGCGRSVRAWKGWASGCRRERALRNKELRG